MTADPVRVAQSLQDSIDSSSSAARQSGTGPCFSRSSCRGYSCLEDSLGASSCNTVARWAQFWTKQPSGASKRRGAMVTDFRSAPLHGLRVLHVLLPIRWCGRPGAVRFAGSCARQRGGGCHYCRRRPFRKMDRAPAWRKAVQSGVPERLIGWTSARKSRLRAK